MGESRQHGDTGKHSLAPHLRRFLGSAIYNLQYQNDPSGMGGNFFKRDWFSYV